MLAKHGDDVRVMAGGQSLGAMLNMRIVTPSILLDINRISALSLIEGGDAIMTGAMVQQADALSDGTIRRDVGLLAQALPHVGHYPDAQSWHVGRFGSPRRSERRNPARSRDPRRRSRIALRATGPAARGHAILPVSFGDEPPRR